MNIWLSTPKALRRRPLFFRGRWDGRDPGLEGTRWVTTRQLPRDEFVLRRYTRRKPSLLTCGLPYGDYHWCSLGGVAQSGRALRSQRRSRRFESAHLHGTKSLVTTLRPSYV